MSSDTARLLNMLFGRSWFWTEKLENMVWYWKIKNTHCKPYRWILRANQNCQIRLSLSTHINQVLGYVSTIQCLLLLNVPWERCSRKIPTRCIHNVFVGTKTCRNRRTQISARRISRICVVVENEACTKRKCYQTFKCEAEIERMDFTNQKSFGTLKNRFEHQWTHEK